jgi:hypothetical protein
MWGNLVASETETDERKIIKQVHGYMTGKRIHVQVRVTDSQGKEIGLDKISESRDLVIKATFQEGRVSYKAPDWVPRNRENVFILFRE